MEIMPRSFTTSIAGTCPSFVPNRVWIWEQLELLEEFDPETGRVLEVPKSQAVYLYHEIVQRFPGRFHLAAVESFDKVLLVVSDLVKWAVKAILESDYQITLEVFTPNNVALILRQLDQEMGIRVNGNTVNFMGSVILKITGKKED